MRKLFFLVPILGIISFVFFYNKNIKSNEPEYVTHIDKIRSEFIADFCENSGCYCHGTGGSFRSNVKEVFVAFHSKENLLDILESRVIVVNATQNLVQRINNSEVVRPFLDKYPFDNKGVQISITFLNSSGERVAKDYVALVFSQNGRIFYSYYDPEEDRLKDLHQESYEDAVRIVSEQGRLEP